MRSLRRSPVPGAIEDIGAGVRTFHVARIFGWQDVAQRYRRSRIGAFWLTANMGVLVVALGVLFAVLFRTPLREFLPYVCAGLVVWGYMAGTITEGCTSFIASEGLILQVRMPLFTHVLRVLCRNAIILAHNLLIFPVAMVAVGLAPTWSMAWAIPGWIVISLNLLWMMLGLAVLCARFRDITQVVQNLLQVMFYMTPLMWMPHALPDGMTYVLAFNPFFHLVSLVRNPLLGQPIPGTSWGVALGLLVIGWGLAVPFFARYRHRVPYWL